MSIARIHHVEPVIDQVLTGQGRNMLNVLQGFDVLRCKSDFHETFGVEGDESVGMMNGCAEFLELQLSGSLFRGMLGQQQFPVTTQNILSIQDVVNGGECDSPDQEL